MLLTLLVQVGIVTTEGLRSKRRYAIVVAFIIAAVLTPPDVVSQLALAIPLLIFYELHPDRRRDRAEARGRGQEDRGRGGSRPRSRGSRTKAGDGSDLQLAMHDIRFIRETPEAFDAGLKKRDLAPLSAETPGDRQAPPRGHLRERGASRRSARRSASRSAWPSARARTADALMAEVAALEQSTEERRAEAAVSTRNCGPARSAAQPAVRRRARGRRRARQRRDPPRRQPAQLQLRAQGPRGAGRGDRRDGLRRRR